MTATDWQRADYGDSISPHAVGVLTARTRWLLSAGVRMGTVNGDTGRVHGPVTDPSVVRVTEPSGFVWTYDASDTELTRILAEETDSQLSYQLDLDRGEYVVTDADGRELFADDWEVAAQRFVSEHAAWPRKPVPCFHCGGSGVRCCEFGADR